MFLIFEFRTLSSREDPRDLIKSKGMNRNLIFVLTACFKNSERHKNPESE
jgi:hypothetical protein